MCMNNFLNVINEINKYVTLIKIIAAVKFNI